VNKILNSIYSSYKAILSLFETSKWYCSCVDCCGGTEIAQLL